MLGGLASSRWHHADTNTGTFSGSRSEDDMMSSVSATVSDVRQHPSVAGLRDRLLREARSERARCLEVAEAAERRRAELRGICHVATQTEPVTIMDGAMATTIVGAPSVTAAGGASLSWSAADEAAQSEALRTIQQLGRHGGRFTESRLADLEAELRAERAGRQELDSQVAHERSRKEAAQQQVLCLEYELDGKEAALQVAERALERRDAELQQVQAHLHALQEGTTASFLGGDETRVRALRLQLAERERQLELKDQHIGRLLHVLRQHRGLFPEEDSTACGSERSMSLSTATMTAAA